MIAQDFLPRTMYKDKTVFVTGGGSGINLGIARNFAGLGAHLALCGRTQAKLDAAADELRMLSAHARGKVLPVAADVRDYAALEAAFARTQAEMGPIDVLVAGAAGNFLCPAEELSPNGFKTVVDISSGRSTPRAAPSRSSRRRTAASYSSPPGKPLCRRRIKSTSARPRRASTI